MNRNVILALVFLSVPAVAQQYECATSLGTNCEAVLADRSTLTSTLLVQPGACDDAARIVDVKVHAKLVHTAVGDLTLTLVHPGGKRVDLQFRAGLSSTTPSCLYDDVDATWSDDATTSVTCSFAIPAIGGTIKPFNPLAAFDGLERNGLWQLVAADAQGVSDGVLLGWGLELPCTLQVPSVQVSTGTRDAVEGDATPATIVFTRAGDLTAALTVRFELTGSAVAGLDYEAPSRSITFAAGAATATLSIVATADGLAETTESAVVTLSAGAAWAVGANATAGVNLIDVTCGDGLKTGPEACDDGNQLDGDGCSAMCEVVPVPAPMKTGCGCTTGEAGLLGLLGVAFMLRRRASASS